MELTPKERDFLRPYLTMKLSEGKGWAVGVALGVLICAGAVFVWFSGSWPGIRPYFFLTFVIGMVVTEISLNRREKIILARILQKYDAAVRPPEAAPNQKRA